MNVNINLLNDNSIRSNSPLVKYQRFKKQSVRLKNIYHKYSSVEELFVSFKQQVPISFVMTTDGKYYSTVKKQNIETVGGISVRLRFAKKLNHYQCLSIMLTLTFPNQTMT